MRTIHRAAAATAVAAAACVTLPGVAHAAAPTTRTETQALSGPIDSCPGFDVLADGSITSRVTTYADGHQSIHLRLVGSVANSVTGLSGRYSEIQVDRTTTTGTSFSAGLLGKLTVPGRGTSPAYAGRVSVSPDGTVRMTPRTAGVDDGPAFHDALCGALS